MPSARRNHLSEATVEETLPPRKPFDIPYFAHQRLCPEQFPDSVGLPVGRPLVQTPTDASAEGDSNWDDDEDEDDDVDNQAPEDEYTVNTGIGKNKRAAIVPLDGEAYKRMKVTGGRPAIAKKVTAEMDSDDELIFNMKNAKYLEKDIAKRLADEGRIFYNPKTIGTRWARLKKAMQAKQDKLLDADLTDWHEGDDEILLEAIKKADEAVEKAKQDAEARKWRIVADHMKTIKPVTNFSKNACKHRYDALQEGKAKPTPESDPNPSAATKARIEIRRERERRIEEDRKKIVRNSDNIQGNAWTSRQRQYFG